ncbi:MAG TPA: hypothetical protein GX392_08330 [Clostridiales bacterium]|nr:hypothetical protein [Clostridiales bacterium]
MSAANEMYVKEFNADLGELALGIEGSKHWKRFNANRIGKIKKTTAMQKKLFTEKPVERIEIFINGDNTLYVIQKDKLKDDFNWVNDVLKNFAEKNKVVYEEEE